MLTILLYIKNIFLRILNFLFGKTKIFIIVLGWFLVITGALFLANPEKARQKLLSQGFGILKWPLRITAIYLAALFVSLGFKFPGIFPKIISLIGVVVITWSFFVLKKRTYNKLALKFAKIPIPALKIYAFIQIVVGSAMLLLERRIW